MCHGSFKVDTLERWGYVQEVSDHIADYDAVGIDIAVFLEQVVERLELCERLGDLEQRPVVPKKQA